MLRLIRETEVLELSKISRICSSNRVALSFRVCLFPIVFTSEGDDTSSCYFSKSLRIQDRTYSAIVMPFSFALSSIRLFKTGLNPTDVCFCVIIINLNLRVCYYSIITTSIPSI